MTVGDALHVGDRLPGRSAVERVDAAAPAADRRRVAPRGLAAVAAVVVDRQHGAADRERVGRVGRELDGDVVVAGIEARALVGAGIAGREDERDALRRGRGQRRLGAPAQARVERQLRRVGVRSVATAEAAGDDRRRVTRDDLVDRVGQGVEVDLVVDDVGERRRRMDDLGVEVGLAGARFLELLELHDLRRRQREAEQLREALIAGQREAVDRHHGDRLALAGDAAVVEGADVVGGLGVLRSQRALRGGRQVVGARRRPCREAGDREDEGSQGGRQQRRAVGGVVGDAAGGALGAHHHAKRAPERRRARAHAQRGHLRVGGHDRHAERPQAALEQRRRGGAQAEAPPERGGAQIVAVGGRARLEEAAQVGVEGALADPQHEVEGDHRRTGKRASRARRRRRRRDDRQRLRAACGAVAGERRDGDEAGGDRRDGAGQRGRAAGAHGAALPEPGQTKLSSTVSALARMSNGDVAPCREVCACCVVHAVTTAVTPPSVAAWTRTSTGTPARLCPASSSPTPLTPPTSAAGGWRAASSSRSG